MQITEYKFANITTRPLLTLNDVNNKWIFTNNTKHVIDLCMHHEPEVIELIQSKGATFDWFPTEERPMDVEAILKAVQELCFYDGDGSHTIVHCLHGDNCSRTVVEAFYFAKYCEHYEDEYKGCKNHLIWNCEQGYLPPLPEMEHKLRRYTPRPYKIGTFHEIGGISLHCLTPLSEEEMCVFKAFGNEYPDKTTSELLKLTFEKTGRYEFDEKERKLKEKRKSRIKSRLQKNALMKSLISILISWQCNTTVQKVYFLYWMRSLLIPLAVNVEVFLQVFLLSPKSCN